VVALLHYGGTVVGGLKGRAVDIAGTLGIVLTIVAIVLAVAAIYGVFVLVRAVKDLQMAAEDVRSRLVPLLEKADVTIDALNAELLRLDAIVSQAEGVGEAVSTASEFIRSPVNTAAQGIARLARSFRRR
jgi:hypothetical protein